MGRNLKDDAMTGSDREPPKQQDNRLPLAFPENVTALPSADRRERLRVIEALLFAAAEPLDEETLAAHLPSGEDIAALLEELQGFYAARGVNLIRVAGKWAFRTADDLAFLLAEANIELDRALELAEVVQQRRSRDANAADVAPRSGVHEEGKKSDRPRCRGNLANGPRPRPFFCLRGRGMGFTLK